MLSPSAVYGISPVHQTVWSLGGLVLSSPMSKLVMMSALAIVPSALR